MNKKLCKKCQQANFKIVSNILSFVLTFHSISFHFIHVSGGRVHSNILFVHIVILFCSL